MMEKDDWERRVFDPEYLDSWYTEYSLTDRRVVDAAYRKVNQKASFSLLFPLVCVSVTDIRCASWQKGGLPGIQTCTTPPFLRSSSQTHS